MSSPNDDNGVQPEDEGQLGGTGDIPGGAAMASGARVDGTDSTLLAEEHIEDAQPDLGLELARAEAEPDAAVAALDKQGRRDRRARKVRRSVVALLVVAFCVLLPVTYVVTWTHYTVLNTNGFVDAVGPIGTDPAVIAAASTELTNEIFSSLNPQKVIASNLPPKASFIAGP